MIRFGGWMRDSLSDMPDELGLKDVEESARLGIAATALDWAMKLCGEAAQADGASSVPPSGGISKPARAPLMPSQPIILLSTSIRFLRISGIIFKANQDFGTRQTASLMLGYSGQANVKILWSGCPGHVNLIQNPKNAMAFH